MKVKYVIISLRLCKLNYFSDLLTEKALYVNQKLSRILSFEITTQSHSSVVTAVESSPKRIVRILSALQDGCAALTDQELAGRLGAIYEVDLWNMNFTALRPLSSYRIEEDAVKVPTTDGADELSTYSKDLR